MEVQTILAVRKSGGKYLLVEDPDSNILHLPAQSVSTHSQLDAIQTAQSLLDEVTYKLINL